MTFTSLALRREAAMAFSAPHRAPPGGMIACSTRWRSWHVTSVTDQVKEGAGEVFANHFPVAGKCIQFRDDSFYGSVWSDTWSAVSKCWWTNFGMAVCWAWPCLDIAGCESPLGFLPLCFPPSLPACFPLCGPLCRLLRLPLCLRLSRAFAHVSPNLFPTLSPNFVSICFAILPPCVFHLVPNLPPSSFVAVSPALSFTVSPLCPPLCSPEFP